MFSFPSLFPAGPDQADSGICFSGARGGRLREATRSGAFWFSESKSLNLEEAVLEAPLLEGCKVKGGREFASRERKFPLPGRTSSRPSGAHGDSARGPRGQRSGRDARGGFPSFSAKHPGLPNGREPLANQRRSGFVPFFLRHCETSKSKFLN